MVRVRRRLFPRFGARPPAPERRVTHAPPPPRTGPAPGPTAASGRPPAPGPDIDLTAKVDITESHETPMEVDWVRAPDATRARLSAHLEAEYWRVAGTDLWTWEVLDDSSPAGGKDRREALWQGIATGEGAAQQAVLAWLEAYQRSQRLPG